MVAMSIPLRWQTFTLTKKINLLQVSSVFSRVTKHYGRQKNGGS